MKLLDLPRSTSIHPRMPANPAIGFCPASVEQECCWVAFDVFRYFCSTSFYSSTLCTGSICTSRFCNSNDSLLPTSTFPCIAAKKCQTSAPSAIELVSQRFSSAHAPCRHIVPQHRGCLVAPGEFNSWKMLWHLIGKYQYIAESPCNTKRGILNRQRTQSGNK